MEEIFNRDFINECTDDGFRYALEVGICALSKNPQATDILLGLLINNVAENSYEEGKTSVEFMKGEQHGA